jgi:adenosylhomocysteine nucleosidase
MNIILFVALESELPPSTVPENVEIYYTGVGKVNAAIKTTNILTNKNPENTLVINYGSAGTNSLSKNQLYKCTKFEQSDIDTRPLTEHKGETPFEINMPTIIMFSDDGKLCSTADLFQTSPSSEIVEMEAYSIAKACKILGFDFVAYKFISDDGSSDEWTENHKNGKDLFLNVLNEILS